jgi:hypothetical protein
VATDVQAGEDYAEHALIETMVALIRPSRGDT